MYAFNKETSIAPYELSELDKVAIEYHYQTETFDRMVIRGCWSWRYRYIPKTPNERIMVKENARNQFRIAKGNAINMWYTVTSLKDKISQWLRVDYEELRRIRQQY